jgi:hypothetical protein
MVRVLIEEEWEAWRIPFNTQQIAKETLERYYQEDAPSFREEEG